MQVPLRRISLEFVGDCDLDALKRIHAKLDAILEGVTNIMSQVSDFADKVNANFAQITAGIAALDAQIVAFQNSPGTLSAADQASLDAIVAASATLATAAQAVVPVTPPAGA